MKALHLTMVAVFGSFIVANSLFAQNPTAFASHTYSVSSSSYFVAAEDINGDGKPDLISADTIGTILTNDGRGGFNFKATLYNPIIPVGFELMKAVPADINGDGKPDLIASDYVLGTGELDMFTNDGNGDFNRSSYLLGQKPAFTIIPADVNGNGEPDLICSYSTNIVLVLTNNSIGVFSSNAVLNVGSDPYAITAADVNGNGKLDLISANYGDNTLTMLTNNGNGVFGSNATLDVGSEPISVAAADVNDDGKVDLIAANYGDNTLTVLTNNGTGAFSFSATLKVGSQPSCVIAADLYGNGKLDLVTANFSDNTLTVLTNNGNGIFGLNATLPVGSWPNCVVAADVNHDGKLDLISANSDGSLTVLTQVAVGLPVLKMMATSTNALILSWSSFLPGYKLLTNSDLTTTNWAPTDNAITTSDGTNYSVMFSPLPSSCLFFRLRQ